MARSTFYYHLSRLDQPDPYASLRQRISFLYDQHKGRYGYRRITLELRNQGTVVNHKTIERLMGGLGVKSLVRVKRYRSYRGSVGKIAPNILQRDFVATAVNQKWATDVTEFKICGVKRYLSPIMNLYNGEIINYTISQHPSLMMVTSMLDQATRRIKSTSGLVLHSGQGWHYQNGRYQQILVGNGIIQSMSSKGNCLDNAVIENFFGILKSEFLYLQKFRAR